MSTHRLQVLQWWARSGLGVEHFLQYRGRPEDLVVRVGRDWLCEGSVVGREV